MIIGIPKEIKEHEYRVSVTPDGVRELAAGGNTLIVERSAGVGSGFSDEEYERAGAELSDKKPLFNRAELIIKVKEPMPAEFEFFQEGQAVFTFLHLAANPDLTEFMLKRNITGFA
ncbi:MAG: alanine dehydrogenase, partial [Nitrospira bacterium SG8_35_4]